MHDHPLFLIPQSQRAKLLERLLPDGDGAAQERSVSEYLLSGDLSYKNRSICDALLASYDGDADKVLNHIQVERIYLSRRYRRGAATIEPQMSVDARIQQVTADRSVASLPKALQHVSLYDPSGPLVDANRGILEYSDLLKRPVETFKYLLSTVETATVSMESFMLHLDMIYIASTNETYLDAFKQHPDFPSFKGRIELVKVPYLLRYSDERAIYANQITPRLVGKPVAPHAIDVAALWAVLTRMRRCEHSLYSKDIAAVIESITPAEKLRLYDDAEVPERLTSREAKELRHLIPDFFKESLNYPNYEGRYGASAREVRALLLNAAYHHDYACLSPFAVFEEIRALLRSEGVYDFLKQEVVDGYHDHRAFLAQTENLFTAWVDAEVRESMGLAREESYQELFSRYVTHITHWVKREKLQDATSGEMRDPDEKFMTEIEDILMGKGEKSEDFRRAIIGTIGARSLDNPDTVPDIGDIFKTYVNRLREDFYSKRRKDLRRIIENFLKYTSDDKEGLTAEERQQIAGMLSVLEARFGYDINSARDVVAYLLKKRYAQ
ncbi:MAG: serine protein kinase PrkA [Myxococcota bacterium]